MKNAESLLTAFSAFFKEKMPVFIKTVNAENSDRLQLDDFYDAVIFGEHCRTLPFVAVRLEQAELTEKDRIIENEVYTLKLELNLQETSAKSERKKLRYVRAVCLFFEEYEFCDLWQRAKITEFKKNSVFVRVEM